MKKRYKLKLKKRTEFASWIELIELQTNKKIQTIGTISRMKSGEKFIRLKQLPNRFWDNLTMTDKIRRYLLK